MIQSPSWSIWDNVAVRLDTPKYDPQNMLISYCNWIVFIYQRVWYIEMIMYSTCFAIDAASSVGSGRDAGASTGLPSSLGGSTTSSQRSQNTKNKNNKDFIKRNMQVRKTQTIINSVSMEEKCSQFQISLFHVWKGRKVCA